MKRGWTAGVCISGEREENNLYPLIFMNDIRIRVNSPTQHLSGI